MQEVDEFRHYAEVCRKLSREMSDPGSKRQLMEMATVWTLLAGEREGPPENERAAGDHGTLSSFASKP
jgi:hypothetical protein